MKEYVKRWLPVLVWMGVLFYFSAQPYAEQDMRPAFAQWIHEDTVRALFGWVSFDYANYEISIAHLGVPGFVEFFVRKGAHVSAFFILALLAYRAWSGHQLPAGQVVLLSLFLVAAYAVFDEFHQSFTKDRTPLWQDSLLDTVGGAAGIGVAWLLGRKKR